MQLNKNKIEKILDHIGFPAVSIIIPTKIVGDYEINRIRWKNELQKVYKELENQGYEKTSFLASARDLLDDNKFWSQQSSGLAGYFATNFSQLVHLTQEVEPASYVNNMFVTVPVLLSQMNKKRAFVLTLSQNNVRFFEAVENGIFPIKTEDLIPTNMADALNLDVQKETLHNTPNGLSSTNNYRDKSNLRLEQFFKVISDGLKPILFDEQVPLVLAGVEEHISLFRKISDYKYMSSHYLKGNVDDFSPAEIRLQVDKVFDEMHHRQAQRIQKEINQDFTQSNTLNERNEIHFNLELGNVKTLILPEQYESLDDTKFFGVEELLRFCYNKNIEVVQGNYENLKAITYSPKEAMAM